ncbi:MAG TPA: hypothetical protein GX738_06920 [Firmicutes bacterium]|jgi:hypothetical protein|nr:hypothetical protein [Bacillota bacterium]
MLYTIVPPEVIWQNSDKITAPQELIYRGQKVLAEPLPQPGEFKLVQLLSSDPALFLNSAFQPGTIIRFPAQQKDK